MTKVRKNILLSRDTAQKLQGMAKEKGISQSEFVNNAINYYIKNDGVDLPSLVDAIDLVFKQHFDIFKSELKRIRHATNSIDKESKMMIEFWNHYFYAEEYGELAITRIFPTKPIKVAREEVENRIKQAQQHKHSS